MKRHVVIPILILGLLSACVSQAAERSGVASSTPTTPVGGLVLVRTDGGMAAADMSTGKVLFNEERRDRLSRPIARLLHVPRCPACPRGRHGRRRALVPGARRHHPDRRIGGRPRRPDRRGVRDLSPRGGRATVDAGRYHGYRERRHAAPEPAWELRARSVLHRRSEPVPHPVSAGRGARSLSSDGARSGQREDLPSREPRQGSPQLDAGDAIAAGVGARPKRALHALHEPGLIGRSPDLRARAQPGGEVGALHRSAGSRSARADRTRKRWSAPPTGSVST